MAPVRGKNTGFMVVLIHMEQGIKVHDQVYIINLRRICNEVRLVGVGW